MSDSIICILTGNKGRLKGYLTSNDYANQFQIKESLVRKWIYNNKLEAIQVGSTWWIKENTPLPPNIAKMKMDEKIKWYQTHQKGNNQ